MKLLIVLSKPPYTGSHTIELIEAALVGAVFDWQVDVLARDAGVWGLVKNQDASSLGVRTVGKVLSALPAYDIDAVHACAVSLSHFELAPDALIEGVQSVSVDEQAAMIARADVVIGASA
ncbi:MAG: DsrE family protein [Pseudomonadota bacterium]